MTGEELQAQVTEVRERLDHLRGFLDVAGKREKLTDLEARMGVPGFWDSREKAQEIIGQVRGLRNVIDPFSKVESMVGDLEVMLEFAVEGDGSEEFAAEAEALYERVCPALDRLEMTSFLGGRMDANGAVFSVNAGAGGTESCDWCSMLYRMYTHWMDRNGYEYEIIDMQPGEEAGTRSVTLMVRGEFAYGYLKTEKGVHRLVRISPFDANKRRHTSFAAVDVAPEIDDDIEVEINDADLRIDTYRSSGAGGQHVNRTDSAVRLTHIPSGIVVTCQNERSQHKNRATAMRVLRARLYQREEEKRRQEHATEYGAKGENAWGSQIRSYVLQPYQLVKDLRTEVETSNVNAVLDGGIDLFIEAFLRHRENGTAGGP
ncbi:MAG: peptide chain release factor 2 [Lentisphaeria bacterium]|nr:peptide chain release factor 2 [Lentisphaeria bacterium]